MWAEDGLLLHDPRGKSSPVARDQFFAELRLAGVERAIVTGVAADYCVRWAVDGLVSRGFTIVVPNEFTRGIERSIDQVLRDDFAAFPVSAHPV